MTYQQQIAAATVYDVRDVSDGGKTVATFPTRRRALNHTRKLEPEATLPHGCWRYVISPRRTDR